MTNASLFARPRRRLTVAITVAACLCALAPAVASAGDFCVHDIPCIQAGNTAVPTLEGALALADNNPSADRIILAPGTYTAPTTSGFSAPQYPVQIIGAGDGATALTGPDNTGAVLTLGNHASGVSNLLIVVPDSHDVASHTGLMMSGGTAKGLSITKAFGTNASAIGANIAGTTFENSKVTLPLSPQSVAVWAGTDSIVRDVDLTAGTGVDAFGFDIRVDRARLTASYIGVFATRINTVITNSLIRLPSGGTGISAGTGHFTSDVGVTARNLTIVGGDGTSTGIDASSFAVVARTATVIADNTIIRGVKHSFSREAAAPSTALLGVMYSAYDPAGIADSGPGGYGFGAGNISADALFAGPDDFHLAAGSPAIDAGDPNPFTDTLDLDGDPRDAFGRRDMGAFESQTAPPAPVPGSAPAPADVGPAGQPAPVFRDTLAPAITGLTITPARFTARHGAHIRLRLSERASVRIVIQRGAAHGSRVVKVATLRRTHAAGRVSVAIKRRIAHAKLRPGRYTAILTATDSAGNRSPAKRVKFLVVR